MIIPVVLLVMVVTMRSWVQQGLVTFLPQYYVNYLHQSPGFAAVLTSVFLFAGALGTLVGGPAADRWGLKSVIVVSMAAQLPLLYLQNGASGFWSVLLVAATGFVALSTFGLTVVFGQELLPNNVGLASGLMLGFAVGMGGVGSTLLGWVADHRGLPVVFQVMILFPLLGLLPAMFLPGHRAMKRFSAEAGGHEKTALPQR
jgi:FSR family fosmidomycin resistance protein-like MFS transporter